MNKKIDILILSFIVFFILNVDKYLDLFFIGIAKKKVLKYNIK